VWSTSGRGTRGHRRAFCATRGPFFLAILKTSRNRGARGSSAGTAHVNSVAVLAIVPRPLDEQIQTRGRGVRENRAGRRYLGGRSPAIPA